MEPLRFFEHCPRCGEGRQEASGLRSGDPFRCRLCGFVLFVNPSGAVAAILTRPDGRAVFVRRALEPALGRLGMPGGFVDAGESAEDALRREVREEIGLETDGLQYLCSHPNRYHFAGVTYHTLDLFFVARAQDPDRARALDHVAEVLWLDPLRLPLEELAFESMRAALARYRAGAHRHGPAA